MNVVNLLWYIIKQLHQSLCRSLVNTRSKIQHQLLIRLRHTVELWAQFANGGHFMGQEKWPTAIKRFYYPSYNKAILWESLITLPDSYSFL